MKRNKLNKAQRSLRTVAREEGVSVDSVREEIRAAIAEAMRSDDPAVRELWQNIPCKGEVPEPEELIAWLAGEVKGRVVI